jgi:hypothetical protein
MDRKIAYTGEIALVDDFLNTQRFIMTALGMALQAILGTGTVVDGLNCTPNSPADLHVIVAAGSIYALENLDSTAYGDLSSDTAHQIVKQGIVLDNTTLSCPAPPTTGQSINYLIQAAYQDVDTDSTVLPYFNSSNPAVAYNGPSNTGVSQNTTRKGQCTISVKAGTAATTGTQTTPAADAGFTGLWVVTVANGATTITSGNITKASAAPFINYKLPQLAPAVVSRTALTGNTTYYVTPSGNDSTGDGTSGSPWQTIQHAVNVIASTIDLAGYTVTIKLNATGSYSGVNVKGPWVGGPYNAVTIVGDTGTSSNTVITGGVNCNDGGIAISNLQVQNSSGDAIGLDADAQIDIGSAIVFGTTTGSHVDVKNGSIATLQHNYNVTGGAAVDHFAVGPAGTINAGSITATGSSSLTFGTYANASNCGVLYAPSYAWSGFSGVTAVQYGVQLNGVININGATAAGYFPGGSSGSTATGGEIG